MRWLADGGSACTAGETVDFATAPNLVPCSTPVRSPEGNGVRGALVRTFERDHVRVNPTPDALFVLRQLPAWCEDHDTVCSAIGC